MKAIVLAGGNGTRMGELTRTTNKHLLPVGSKPMIYWPLEFLVKNGFDEILIVVGRKSCGELLRQAGDGSRFGARFFYAYQENEGGIAEALSLADGFEKNLLIPFPVMLGDNIYDGLDLKKEFTQFVLDSRTPESAGAHVFLTEREDYHLFGVADMMAPGLVSRIVEKPKEGSRGAKSLVVTGLYIYNGSAFSAISTLNRSKRGELEITDLNNWYAREGKLTATEFSGTWVDMGNPKLYYQSVQWARQFEMSEVSR